MVCVCGESKPIVVGTECVVSLITHQICIPPPEHREDFLIHGKHDVPQRGVTILPEKCVTLGSGPTDFFPHCKFTI